MKQLLFAIIFTTVGLSIKPVLPPNFATSNILEVVIPTSPFTPHYYYNRETAFLINYAIDPTNGGLYLATDGNGAIVDLSSLDIWNFTAPSGLMSDIKTTSAQSMGILYFIREYHRAKEYGFSELNALILDPADTLASATELLTTYAKNIADFCVTGDPFEITNQTALGADANKMYYYGYTEAGGTGGMLDGTDGASNAESMLPWALAELALIMSEAGVSSTVYQPYIDEAVEWWNWRKTSGVHVVYGWGQNANYGSGKDVYYGTLGLTLYELTNNTEYRDGGGNMADGEPLGALPYMYNALGAAGNNPDLGNPPGYAIQDGAYVAGYSRGACYSKAAQRPGVGMPNYKQRQPFQEFGFSPLFERGNSYPVYDINSTTELVAELVDPSIAFAHFAGREVYAGTQRTLWFNYSFDINNGVFYANNGSNPNFPADFTNAKQKEMIFDYWNFCYTSFWDNTSGVAAWTESTGATTYKPCFSGGVDVPIADWKAPTIGGKSHIWTTGNSATITITDVVDEDWDFLSWQFLGIGVSDVEVVYSTDNGTTWQTAAASNTTGDNYAATIPAATITNTHNAGYHFYYFIRAADEFNNYEFSPTGLQSTDENGLTTINGLKRPLACLIQNPSLPICPPEICLPINYTRN
ncbi:MAG: hypothetical protein AB8G22_10170 [Saprospiraceae bacterium]